MGVKALQGTQKGYTIMPFPYVGRVWKKQVVPILYFNHNSGCFIGTSLWNFSIQAMGLGKICITFFVTFNITYVEIAIFGNNS